MGTGLCAAALKCCWGCPALCWGEEVLDLVLSARDEPQALPGKMGFCFCWFCDLLATACAMGCARCPGLRCVSVCASVR